MDRLIEMIEGKSAQANGETPGALNPAAIPIARATSAALLVVRVGESRLAAARSTIEAVGRERLLGSVVLEGA